MKRLLIYLVFITLLLLSLFNSNAQTVRVNPSKDTTLVTVNISFTTKVLPTVKDSLPPVDTSTAYVGYSLVFSDYFNKDSDIDPDSHGQAGNGFIDYGDKYEGNGSFASRTANVSSGIRSEVQLSQGNHSPKEGLITYYAKYKNFFSDGGHSFQFHPDNSGSGNGFYHVNGKLVYRNVTKGTATYKDYPFNYSPSLNIWHKFEIYYKLGLSGYMKVYVDGALYVNVSGVQIGDLSDYYIKLGVNMWIQQTSNVNYDSFNVYKKI